MANDALLFGGGSETKTLNIDQFFELVKTQQEGEESPSGAFGKVAWAYRCVNLRADALSKIPVGIYPRGVEEEDAEIETELPLEHIAWMTEAALSIYGAAYWVIVNKIKIGKEGLFYLNPGSMRVEAGEEGIKYFEQKRKGEPKKYEPEEIVYHRLFNPNDDLGPGISPMSVALGSAKLIRNANDWAASFFENSAIPAVLLYQEYAPGNELTPTLEDREISRIRTAWERLVRGAKKSFRTAVLRKGLKAQILQPPVGELAVPELMASMVSQIAGAFGVPKTILLADAANYATSKQDDIHFYTKTVFPDAQRIAETFNEQLFYRFQNPLEMRFKYDAIEAIQKDESEKGENIARLGEFVKGLKGSGIINVDEARMYASELLQDIGLEALGEKPEDLQQNMPFGAFQQGQDKELQEELRKWQGKIQKRISEGKAFDKAKGVEFDSDIIPPAIRGAIEGALEHASEPGEIKTVFDAAMTWEGYP